MVKKIPSVIINHLRCLPSYKMGIVEDFQVSLHFFFSKGQEESFQFAVEICNFHVHVVSLIMSFRALSRIFFHCNTF